MKVMFAGPSGIGKSTLANILASEYTQVPFISGSVSDLIPSTKEVPHQEMLNKDSKDAYLEDYQIVNLRNKLFKDKEHYISDRSYLDSAAYFYFKQAKEIPECEIEHFITLCKMLLNQQCEHLIFLHWDISLSREWWIEDNNKRIQSPYFQVLISDIMSMILRLWEAQPLELIHAVGNHWWDKKELQYGAQPYLISSPYGETKVLQINELNKDVRIKLIEEFLDL